MRVILALFFTFLVSFSIYSQTPTTYTTFQGQPLNLYAWQGSKVAVLSRLSTLTPSVMASITKVLDSTYMFYHHCTGKYPVQYTPTLYNGKSTVADVAATCGAGCGYMGFTGIELMNSYFDRLYDSVRLHNTYDQPIFYEFGRNFWFYGNKLEYFGTDNTGAITTGYAVFMRFKAIESASVSPAYFNSTPFSYFKTEVKNLFSTYMANPSYNWSNTLKVGVAPTNPMNLGATDLFASFLFKLTDLYGDNYYKNIWKKADLQPNATTTQEALDNFFIASCAAVNCDLGALFSSWKFPISTMKLNFATATYPSCVTNIVDSYGMNSSNSFKIYPNPTSDNYTIDTERETYVSVTNILGEAILTQKLQDGKNEIDLSNQSRGIYFIKTENSTYKLIKQ